MLGVSTLRMLSFAEFCYGIANSKNCIWAILAIYLPVFWGGSFWRRRTPYPFLRGNALWSHKTWHAQMVFIWKSWNMRSLFCFEISTTVYFFCPQTKQTKKTNIKQTLFITLSALQIPVDIGSSSLKKNKTKPPSFIQKDGINAVFYNST